MKRITLIISSLSAGGAERVMTTMANYWAKKGWEITLITLDSYPSDFYELSPRVKRIRLDATRYSRNVLAALKNNLVRIFKLRREICRLKPDAVVCFMNTTNIITLLASRGLNLKVIVSERTHPEYHDIGRIWSWLRPICYPWADAIVGQSEDACNWLNRNIGKGSIVIIPNPIYKQRREASGQKMLEEIIGESKITLKTVVAMGRLSPEKGFDLLVKSFATIGKAQSSWSLIIFGEGKERSPLARLAGELGIADRVFLPGAVKNPVEVLRQADLFVLSSRYEGFPNALCEAMACGLPVISFDCPSGPREIVRDGVDGILVPAEDVAALAEAMRRLMQNDTERSRLAARAPEVLERFGLDKIMSMWENIIFTKTEKPCD